MHCGLCALCMNECQKPLQIKSFIKSDCLNLQLQFFYVKEQKAIIKKLVRIGEMLK